MVETTLRKTSRNNWSASTPNRDTSFAGSAISKCFGWIIVIARLVVLCAVILFVYEPGYLLSYGEWPRAYSFNTNTIALSNLPWLEDWAGLMFISIRMPLSELMFCLGMALVGITYLLHQIIGNRAG